MHPRDKSVTISSESITNSFGAQKAAEIPIQFVKGVGPGLGAVFKNRQIGTVQDLLFFFPRAYEDRSQILKVSELREGVTATLSVRVLSQRKIPVQKFRKSILEVKCTDDSGVLTLKWFHSPRGMEKKFVPGACFMLTGKAKMYMGKPEIIHPEITWGIAADINTIDEENSHDQKVHHNIGRIVPIYTEIEGIPTRTLRKVLWEAVSKFQNNIEEDIPLYLLEKRKLPRMGSAITEIHFPSEQTEHSLSVLEEFGTPAHHRFIYGEFFKFEFLMLRKKLRLEKASAPPFSIQSIKLNGKSSWEEMLPFQLTEGQKQALQDIFQDVARSFPMNRLVQGDVGSGKTAVALLSAAAVLDGGAQAAIMAPTEILAEQHYKNALKLFQGKLNIALLTGRSTVQERQSLQKKLTSGEPLLVIGTHALIEDSVQFSQLAYVIIDEQHRFGVEQRKALRLKGMKKDPQTSKTILPHSLVLTATPIPRTLALTAFGDLSVTSIRDVPPGRSPVKTTVVGDEKQRIAAIRHIKEELQSGRQAYFIYPLIHESEAEGFTQLKSAIAEAEELAKNIFPEFKVSLLHGQMRPEEKAEVMDQFKQGKSHILVSTTVIEVGVDVPNATIIVIEHAERFGLSQLHQLRGRVGRGSFQSYCYLFSSTHSQAIHNPRLGVLAQTHDGFKIAEADLEIRGPGEFLGTRQAGLLPFKMANLVRDREWLIQARDDAMEVLSSDPELQREEHICLRSLISSGGVSTS